MYILFLFLFLFLFLRNRVAYRRLDGPAIFAMSNMQSSFFRYGHDIAIPLPPVVRFEYLGSEPSKHRKYFATFKVRGGQLHRPGTLVSFISRFLL